MNKKLFDERESELPEVFIFENYYQVNLKYNKLLTPAPELYPSLEITDLKNSATAPGSIEGFYNAVDGTIVNNAGMLSALPAHIYLVRIPEPRQLDAEGFARLHEDTEVFDYRHHEQKWDCYAATILPREDALVLFDQLKDKQQLNTSTEQTISDLEKEVHKGHLNNASRQPFRIRQDRHAGRRGRRL